MSPPWWSSSVRRPGGTSPARRSASAAMWRPCEMATTEASAEPIAVVGSGLIGRSWAISFARAGHPVRLYDAAPGAAAAAVTFIDSVIDDLAANGLMNGSTPEAVREKLIVAGDGDGL